MKEAFEAGLSQPMLFLARELSEMAAGLTAAERSQMQVLIAASLAVLQDGSTAFPLGRRQLGHVLERLGVPQEETEETLALGDGILASPSRFHPVIGSPGDICPLIAEKGVLYHQRLHAAETRVARNLIRISRAGRAMELPAPPSVEGLSPEQRVALERAVTQPVTLISGGPGTGKTSLVIHLLRQLERAGIPLDGVVLAAPTGKAANRMAESIGSGLGGGSGGFPVLPLTLHRLLAFSPESSQFMRHENYPVRAAAVIVDEGSMIGLGLMDSLLRALESGVKLVILGDADQLPSVDAGAAFRDLVAAFPGTHRLTRNYRIREDDPAGSQILEAAGAVRAQRSRALRAGRLMEIRNRPDALAYQGVELLSPGTNPRFLTGFLENWFRRHVRRDEGVYQRSMRVFLESRGYLDEHEAGEVRALFRHYERFRILTVTRGAGHETGAEDVNTALHGMHAKSIFGERSLAYGRHIPEFLAGEPVLMERNDYAAGLFNGDQGMVLRVAPSDAPGAARLTAVFPQAGGRFRVLPLEALRRDVSLAFAMTVHKSQGSEFDTTALILPREPLPLLTRELVYTAMTRSRKSVVIVGLASVLEHGIETKLERFSTLASRVRQALTE